MTPVHRRVEIRAPSRLHFGLFSFGDPSCPLQFGGIGAMIDAPGLRLHVTPSHAFEAAGPHAGRVAGFAQRIASHLGWKALPRCRVEVLSAPRQHVGLGVGTQLGMAVAAGMYWWHGRQPQDAEPLAKASARGRRSAIGAHGFCHGGLLIDAGHQRSSELGRLARRCALPERWRFVLAIASLEEGLASSDERAAFAATPPVPADTTTQLHRLAIESLLPAAKAADYPRFAESLYAYGLLAGKCFAAVQGGPFASRAVADRVELIRALGYPGCGQSSWGPTVFAVTPDAFSAESLVEQLRRSPQAEGCELVIASPNNTGASITVTKG